MALRAIARIRTPPTLLVKCSRLLPPLRLRIAQRLYDPQGQNYLEYALFEPGGGEDACNYSYYGTGEDISVHWFSDDDPAPYEYPVMTRVEADNSETVVKSFRSALLRYQDSLQVLGQRIRSRWP